MAQEAMEQLKAWKQNWAERLTKETGLCFAIYRSSFPSEAQALTLRINRAGENYTLYYQWTLSDPPDKLMLHLLEKLALHLLEEQLTQASFPRHTCYEELLTEAQRNDWDPEQFRREMYRLGMPELPLGIPILIKCQPWQPEVSEVLQNFFPEAMVHWTFQSRVFLWLPLGIDLQEVFQRQGQGNQLIQQIYSLLADELGIKASICIGQPNQNNLWQSYLEVKRLATIKQRFFPFDPGLTAWHLGFASLLANLDWQSEEQFINKILGQLSKELAETLAVFLKHDLSLGETAKELFIHRNTLNYRLDRITDLTGYNPRQVDGAVHCYLAIWLKKHGGREG